MKEVTHYVFSLGVAFALTSSLREQFGEPSWILSALAVWLSFSVNRVIDGGLGHTFKQTPEGELPVRSWRTHSVFTAPLWGVFVGFATVLGGWFFLEQVPFVRLDAFPLGLVLWASSLGAVVAYSHLLPDSLTQAGVYYWRKRTAIAHWRYDNPIVNALFTIIGIGLIMAASRFLNG